MKVKKNISIDENIKDRAIARAKQLGMDFSGYMTYLIVKDLGEIAVTEEAPKKNQRVSEAVDAILGF